MFQLGGLLVAFVLFASSINAQKFGYLNSAAVLASMTEVQQAEQSLQVLEQKLKEKGQKMVEDFQSNYKEAAQKAERGELSPKQQEEVTKKLQEEEAGIGQFEQDMVQQIQNKRNELYKPIFEKVNTAINTVADNNEFQFIFDASPGTGILLYADTSQNVTKLIMDELGIKIEAPESPEESIEKSTEKSTKGSDGK